MSVYKVLFLKFYTMLTLLTLGLFSRLLMDWGTKKAPSLEYVLYILQWWHLVQLYFTQRKSKKYINHVTRHLSSADIVNFSPKT